MNNIIVDTGFWFALYDTTDEYHKKASELFNYLELESIKIVIPFPTLYETINTKFTKNYYIVNSFEKFLQKPEVIMYPDDEYRNDALNLTFDIIKNQKRNLSLTDNVIRMIMDDDKNMIDYLITFNAKDFTDICRKRNIEILSE